MSDFEEKQAEIEANGALFEVDGEPYTLRYNIKKMEQVESILGVSLISQMQQGTGMLPISTLRALFTVGLTHTADKSDLGAYKKVTGKKATDLFDTLIHQNGYMDITQIVIGKFQEDMGFLFR